MSKPISFASIASGLAPAYVKTDTPFLTTEERERLLATKKAFTITAVGERHNRRFGKDEHTVTLKIEGLGLRVLTLSKGSKNRDDMLAAIGNATHDGEVQGVRLDRTERGAWTFVAA